jgi:hypothetical protein
MAEDGEKLPASSPLDAIMAGARRPHRAGEHNLARAAAPAHRRARQKRSALLARAAEKALAES